MTAERAHGSDEYVLGFLAGAEHVQQVCDVSLAAIEKAIADLDETTRILEATLMHPETL